jgi:peptide deformylase
MLQVIQAPHPILSQKAKRVGKVDKNIANLIKAMEETLDAATDPIGVGLAGPQVGKALDIFVIKPSPKSKLQAFINPKIVRVESDGTDGRAPDRAESVNRERAFESEKKSVTGPRKLEGCLSLKNIWGEVERAKTIWLTYTDEFGKIHHKKFSGFVATIIQHECDHLNGVLFPKRVLEQKGTLYESKKDEKGEDYFEELKI